MTIEVTKEDEKRYNKIENENTSTFEIIEYVFIYTLIALSLIYVGTHWALNFIWGARIFVAIATVFVFINLHKSQKKTYKLMKLAETVKLKEN